MSPKLYTTFALAALAALFIIQNFEVVELRLLFWTIAMSRALMFLLLVLIGMAIGWLLRGHLAHKGQERTERGG